ncbi:HBL/NHE enterotoxin family protein [Clavibacter californiensis]|uniref:Uncharacterized protein n=1 Tax=Clavibacter californiensis TaxID=1401995 RepID=A0ABX9NCH9_9MICO|nr:HBL/NHE enterotoxin family protein [Clavibacter californiensis]RII94850.1 hypothetical protein DZF98_00050 [Clavibacter californiensis]UKF81681.1 HBL/NHE enterotoxin family protein [Clavibacter californiensis]
MKLSTIIAAAPTNQALADYQNACATINQYAYGILNTTLPTLNQPPATYADFATSFAPARGHCITWTDGIFANMLAFPGIIANQAADLFQAEDTLAGNWLDILIADPTNATAKAKLGIALSAMQQTVQNQLTNAQNLVTSLNQFSSDITADGITLGQLAQQALQGAGGDQDAIANLTADIDSLNNEIQTLNNMVTAAEIGIGVSLFFGVVGVAVCLIPGGQGVGLAIIGISVVGLTLSIVGTVLYSDQIKAKNNAVQSDRNSISQLNQDVAALQAVNLQFVWLQQANVAAQNALAAVVEMWEELDTELANTFEELTTVGSDVTSEQYQQAQDDLTAAAGHWADVVAFATALDGIDYQWQDASGAWHSYPQAPHDTVPTMLPTSPSASA